MKSKIALLFMLAIIIFSQSVQSQGVSINDDGSGPAESAMLDIQSDSKGLLIPRLDFIQMFTIESPATGLIVYNTTFNKFYYYDGLGWERITGGDDNSWTAADANIYANNTGNVGIGIEEPTHKLTLQNENSSDLLRLVGPGAYGSVGKINFGDAEYVYISEYMDDNLKIYGGSGLALISDQNISLSSSYSDLILTSSYGGVKVGNSSSEPDPSAILDVSSNSKGMLIPRMTTVQIGTIVNPADGLQAYNSDNGFLYIFVEAAGTWKQVNYGSSFIAPPFEACGDLLTDTRDSKVYTTVEINGQCWMAQNLNYGTYLSTGFTQSNNSTHEKYCYNNNTAYCDNLGGLYQWNEMMDYSTTSGAQGICMDGWHVPTDAEWYAMENFLDPTINNATQTGWRGSSAGQKLKNSGQGPPYNWYYGNTGTNTSGFTAMPGGVRNTSGGSSSSTYNGAYWSSTQSGTSAYDREFYYGYNSVYRNAASQNYGLSVRCIKDENQ